MWEYCACSIPFQPHFFYDYKGSSWFGEVRNTTLTTLLSKSLIRYSPTHIDKQLCILMIKPSRTITKQYATSTLQYTFLRERGGTVPWPFRYIKTSQWYSRRRQKKQSAKTIRDRNKPNNVARNLPRGADSYLWTRPQRSRLIYHPLLRCIFHNTLPIPYQTTIWINNL